jgi:hypothetical protein
VKKIIHHGYEVILNHNIFRRCLRTDSKCPQYCVQHLCLCRFSMENGVQQSCRA